MKIIKKGKVKSEFPKKVTCYNCKTVLEYTKSDIVRDYRDGDFIKCLVCKSAIAIT